MGHVAQFPAESRAAGRRGRPGPPDRRAGEAPPLGAEGPS